MRTLTLAAVVTLALIAAPTFAQSVDSYDDTWHRAPFWSGEYPDGFSVIKTTTVQLRPTLDPRADKSIACELPQGATYQPWNAARVADQGLSFVSYTRIADYKFTKPFETTLTRTDDGTQVPQKFKAGDVFRYLTYYSEGAFLMEYDGVQYDGDQSLFEVSEQEGDTNGYEEWLRISCPNNQWGWLFMGDVVGNEASFTSPNITEYGTSKDLE